jgi:hypothetical protein
MTIAPIKAWAVVFDGLNYGTSPPTRIGPDEIHPRHIYTTKVGAEQAGNGREVVEVNILPQPIIKLPEEK